ncbi:hypothetical protein ACHAQJ_006902 [Trichoderma viride]
MPEAIATDPKSPKAFRKLKTGGEPLRQVHFQSSGNTIKPTASASNSTSTSTSTSAPATTTTTSPFSTTAPGGEGINVAAAAPDNQPESFPQLGAAPNSAFGTGQWHTSIDPTQSIKLPGQPFAGGFAPGFTCTPQHAHFLNNNNNNHNSPFSPLAQLSTPITYIGGTPQHHHQHQPQPFTTMADYQNAAPMPAGVNFQPPVPDTTFGPIPHVYVPRFDGNNVVFTAVHVGLPSVQFVSAPAACSTTVVMPKTFCYHNGYIYYASRPAANSSLDLAYQQPLATGQCASFAPSANFVVAQQPAVVPQPFVGQQPVMIGGQAAPTVFSSQQMHPQLHSVPAMGMSGAGGIPVIAGNGSQIPDVSGLGRTPGEETVRQLQFAHANKLFEPQEFKPSDDDPSRFYYVREVDGNWTQRNRFTIDHLGDCRWYVTDEGWFYAVRMPN